jgi:Mn-dependent DtxR family transcriptional regulator
MASWTFLTYHARVLLLVAHDPGARLRDIAANLDITERSAFGILTDPAEAGYVVKEKNGPVSVFKSPSDAQTGKSAMGGR